MKKLAVVFSNIILKNTKIYNQDGYQEPLLADIRDINLYIQAIPIIVKKDFVVGLYRVDMKGVTLNVIRKSKSNWNVSDILSSDSSGSASSILFNGIKY